MIQRVQSFVLCSLVSELSQISLFKGYSLVYCEETRRWYRRDNGQWTEDILMLPEWGDIQGEPPNFPGGASAWGDITGTLADQTDLQTALDGKAPTHTHPYASDSHNHDASYAPVSHTHSTADVTGLDTALAGKASTTHSHVINDVTGLQTALDGKSATGHNHDANYAAIGHNHAGTYEPANANIQAHIASAHAPANAQKNSDILKSEIEAVLTGVIASHSHSGGSDPWTYVKLDADFTTSSATAVNVTGFNFTPAINSVYVIEGLFFTRTATATVGVRPGCSWPTSLTDGVARFMQTSSATASVIANGNMNAAVLAPVGGNPNNTQSYPATLWATIITGGSTSGNFQIQLASETGGTNVTLKANSWIRYRTI